MDVRTVASLGWQCSGELHGTFDPSSKIVVRSDSRWLHSRPSFHDFPRDVHWMDKCLRLNFVMLLPIESHDQRALPRPNAHIAVYHEARASEHFHFGVPFAVFHQRANPINERYVFFRHNSHSCRPLALAIGDLSGVLTRYSCCGICGVDPVEPND